MRLPAVVAALTTLVVTASAANPALTSSASAFVRAQADAAVNWQPWDEAVLQRAKAEGRPVYVFIGAGLHELSRATLRQSLANPANAEFLNRNFLCVLVDRDERPDVAAAAQAYVRALRQTSGWPVHLWLTPELLPFEGDAYLPPTEEWGKRGFIKVATQAGEAWSSDAARCRAVAEEARATLEAADGGGRPGPATGDGKARLADAAAAWRTEADAKRGAFGAAPAPLDPELVRFLLTQSPADREAALGVLRGLLGSAARDPVDGGFFRYTVDGDGQLPYLQKTLADQARLALALLDAARVSGDAAFARAARGALDYALARLRRPDGTWLAAEDGTPEEHADYYSWSEAEIDQAFGADAAAFKAALGVKPGGNISEELDPAGQHRGRNFLRLPAGEAKWTDALSRLRRVRDGRPAPLRAESATSGAHGLLLAALAGAAVDLRDKALLDAAAQLFTTIGRDLLDGPDGELRRMRGSSAPASASDYAAVALGCAEYGRVANDAKADDLADRLLARAGERYFDGIHGRYFAAPVSLPTGIFFRPLPPDEAPRAEPLALLAGVPAGQGKAMRQALAALVEESPQAAGDVLLALAREP